MKMKKNDNFGLIELEEGDLEPAAYTHRLPLGKPTRETARGKVTICLREEAVEALGEPGRLISASKTAYGNRYPDHEVLFNACLFDEAGTEIWFGDLDLTLEEEKLKKLADRIGPITLTPEFPYRFDGLGEEATDDQDVRVYRAKTGGE